ncbi:MAG: efflux RND transporter periplasmic adaptor subunit [Hyphomicrobiaceae bacterium]|jgi:RND family efflux transporter MFP subunit|nr:MAG: efflux RND transporter periplasmic adaptor subunit [Hyphomicrobiaceae bacterium]MBZ0145254.1 efflux RND transporter periplasmic adaptor subunit [Rhodocyclaceae bacterium]
MSRFGITRRSLALIAVLTPLAALFVWVALRSGPLAPVPVTVVRVESRTIVPALFGIGTVEARYTHRIGPTVAGRVLRVDVQVGDRVEAGQSIGEMDAIDVDQRLAAQEAAIRRAQAEVLAADAAILDAAARRTFAQAEERRYEQLAAEEVVSQEAVEARRQESQMSAAGDAGASAKLEAARQELARARAEREALIRQRAHLRLVAPVAGLVVARNVDPGTTAVAGQAVVELIAPDSLWIQTRFEQLLASGLRAGLPVRIVLRSRSSEELPGTVLRLEPLADAVTEESLAKVAFDTLPDPLPAIGELAEVTVALPPLPAAPVAPNASLQRLGDRAGVWVIEQGELRFAPVRIGESDLDGQVQILEGLAIGDEVVVYSQRALGPRSRVKVVERLPGVAP